ncbi:MAG: hypothetical protein HRT38_18845 [Alteromonadaceae bacterium]|nr:hypothetical protein [Alteromonadaceae bacterium]
MEQSLSFIVLWTVSFALSVAIFTAIIKWLMNKTDITNKTKKLVFVAGGFAFCTPFPFPLSIFGMFFLPSIFAITEFGGDYFWKLQAFTIPSCIFSFLICAVIAKIIFKDD